MSLDSAIFNQTIAKKKQGLISKNKKCFDSADYFENASNYAGNQQIVAPTQNSPNYADDEEIVSAAPTKNADTQQDQLSLEDLIHLSMKLKQKTVQSNSFVEQTFPMLVSLFAKDVKSTARLPVDLICVIDNSGSMQGEKIELVKSTLNLLLRYLGDMDRLSIVTFNSNAFRLNPLLRANEANKERIVRDIKGIYAGGGTDINLGMRQAFEILEKRRYKNPVTSVFLLSDGQDMGAQSKVQASLAQYISLKSLTVNTFGFGNDHDSQLMSDIAGLRDGNFYFIKELDEVDKTFVDCLGGLLSSVAQRVEIKIKPEQSEVLQGIEIIKAYGDNSMWKHENQVYTTSFLNLISGSQKDFVLEVKIPTNARDIQDHERSVKIASVEAEIVDFENQHCIKKADLYITLENEGEESKEEEVEEADREVMKNFFRLRSAALMNEARNLADQNKNEEANKVLQNFKEELENSFMKDEQFIKNLIQDIEKAKTYVKPQMYKKVGKHGLLSNSRAHTYQKTTFDSANYFCFQNKKQTEMLEDLATMKNQ